MSPWLVVKKAYIWFSHQHNSFSFDQIIPKLVDKMEMDEVLDWKLKTVQIKLFIIELSPLDCWNAYFDLGIGTTPSGLIRCSWIWHGLKLSGQSDHEVIHSRPRWMSDARPTVIRRSRIRSPPVRQHSIMEIDHKIFLRSYSLFRWFMKRSCQFLAKECTQILVNCLDD